MTDTAWTRWLDGVVVAGHGVASGLAKSDQFPGGAIALQTPIFAEHGVDLRAFYPGTINVDVSPEQVAPTEPRHRLELVEWLPGYPAETFSFADLEIEVGASRYAGLLYYPHPETKREHHQSPNVLEALTAFVPGLGLGDAVRVRLAAPQVSVGKTI